MAKKLNMAKRTNWVYLEYPVAKSRVKVHKSDTGLIRIYERLGWRRIKVRVVD